MCHKLARPVFLFRRETANEKGTSSEGRRKLAFFLPAASLIWIATIASHLIFEGVSP
jgi:hypothetical protein